jgi:hypothetical protein
MVSEDDSAQEPHSKPNRSIDAENPAREETARGVKQRARAAGYVKRAWGINPVSATLFRRSQGPTRLWASCGLPTVIAQSSGRFGFPLAIGRRNVAAIIAERGTTMTVGKEDDRDQTDAGE